ncbi:MAG: amidohydrolase, partial [Chloroflexi bacterium]|nr:amidohydrolase [Chloroflexota bacterium]
MSIIKPVPELRPTLQERVAALAPKIIEIRREIHRHPERSKREEKTAAFVASHLAGLGYTVKHGVNVHSAVATLNGQKEGKTLALRADMDALKLQEQTGLPFASEVEGVMHACGHDAHTAILLGVAEILSGLREVIPGNVKFLFQPSEEAFPGGALPMIREGALEDPRVDAALALHVDATLPTGYIAIRPGPSIGGVTAVSIIVKGVGGHFSEPKDAVDPIVVAAHVITALQSMVTRQVDYREPFVLTFGQILGGTRDNIIPGEVVIRGDMGSLNTKLREDVEQNIERLVKGITASFGATYEIKFWRGYPTVENDPRMVTLVREVAVGVLGEANVLTHEPKLAGEDFAYFSQKVPSAFWWLGAWDRAKHKVPTPHHDPRFDIDEKCIPLGMELTVRLALEYLLGETNPK